MLLSIVGGGVAEAEECGCGRAGGGVHVLRGGSGVAVQRRAARQPGVGEQRAEGAAGLSLSEGALLVDAIVAHC